MPVISAQPDPQIWYMGSAVDQTIMEDGVVFARVRDRALNGNTDRLAYFEWSLDAETPDEVELELPRDLLKLAAANPAYGIRISADYLEAEWRELDARTHAVERGGVGDWPPVDGSSGQVIPVALWDALASEPVAIVGPVSFAFDVTPDRSASSIVAAGLRPDGVLQAEVVEHRAGTSWVAARVVELAAKHRPSTVLCDGTGPAGSLIYQIEQQGIEVDAIAAGDHAKACGHLYDLVIEQQIRHLGSPDLRSAIKGATKRPLGDAWAWSRRSSNVDISPLVSATLAAWAASTVPSAAVFTGAW
jgi:hypothetical protein